MNKFFLLFLTLCLGISIETSCTEHKQSTTSEVTTNIGNESSTEANVKEIRTGAEH